MRHLKSVDTDRFQEHMIYEMRTKKAEDTMARLKPVHMYEVVCCLVLFLVVRFLSVHVDSISKFSCNFPIN